MHTPAPFARHPAPPPFRRGAAPGWALVVLAALVATMSFYVHVLNQQVLRGEQMRQDARSAHAAQVAQRRTPNQRAGMRARSALEVAQASLPMSYANALKP